MTPSAIPWLVCMASVACVSTYVPAPRRQVPSALTLPDGRTVRYLLYEPRRERGEGLPPLLLFLHGAGERGADLDLVRREGLPRLLDWLERFPFLVISPQGASKRWDVDLLAAFLEEALRRHPADANRIAVTGLSTGADAALALAARRPEIFSAVVAVTPDRPPEDLCPLSRIPVWVFQNRRDVRVPARKARRLVRRIEACGGSARLTLYAKEGHDAWSDAYVHPGLYDWIRAQRRAAP